MGWNLQRIAPNTDLTYFNHPIYGDIIRFSRIHGRNANAGPIPNGFGTDGMHFIYRVTKSSGTDISWMDPEFNDKYLFLQILLSENASDDNAQQANTNFYVAEENHYPGYLGATAVAGKFGGNGFGEFNFHAEILNYHQALNMTVEQFKSMEYCAYKAVLYYGTNQNNQVALAESQWDWGYTKTCDRYYEGMTIEGPSQADVEWGGAVELEFTWNPGPIWMVEAPQVTSASYLPYMVLQNYQTLGGHNNYLQMDLYKPRFNNFSEYFTDFGGAGGVFINVPTDELTNSGFINWDNAFTDWNRGAITNEYLYSATIDGLWYGDYFDAGNTLAQTTIDELGNNLKTPWYGDVTLVDPQTGPIYGWGWQPDDYVATDYFLETPTQVTFPLDLFQFSQENFEPDNDLVGTSYLTMGAPNIDAMGNIQSYDNLTGIDVTDNFEFSTIGGGGIAYMTANYDHRFKLIYQHNGETGSLQTDKFYIFLYSATGHTAIKTVNINIGLDPGFYDDLLIPFEEDIWLDVPELDYEPTEDGTTIQRPPDIIYHLFEVEMGYSGGINQSELEEARMIHKNFDEGLYKMAFSIKDEMKGSKLISMIAQESYCLPTLTNNKLGFKLLKPTYDGNENNIVPITHSSIIDFASERESTSNIITRVKTYYDFNPSTENYVKDLPALTIGSSYLLPAYDPGYYNLDQINVDGQLTYNHLKYTKDVELRLIRDTHTALEWTVQHLLDNCQPHNLLTITLPLRYCFLELGDIVKFPEGPYNNENILGEDYSRLVVRNGQYILPLFIIYDIVISDTVKIKCRQLHHNSADALLFENQNYITISGDSPSWDGTNPDTGEAWSDDGYLGPPDIDPVGAIAYSGDLNADGQVNVQDIIQTIGIVLGTSTVGDDVYLSADVNQDGNIDVLDVVQMVGWILNGLGPFGEEV